MPSPLFVVSLAKIACIDMLLSGDNALVIAMVCRGLPPRQRFWGMTLGAAGAVLLRVACTGGAAEILNFPYLRTAGGLFLLAIAVKMIAVQDDDGDDKKAAGLIAAVWMIVLADITMSVDNVVAVAAAAQGDLILLALGLAMSIPLVVVGAAVITGFLDRFPFLVWAGGALLGWIAGGVIATDSALAASMPPPTVGGAADACFVLVAAAIWRIVNREAERSS